jgi:hypothetical protein
VSLTIQVQISAAELAAARARLDPRAFQARVGAAMAESLLYLQRAVVRRTSAVTGALRASIGVQRLGPLTGAVRTALEYAGHVEYGTRPHTIRPRRKRALYWAGAAHPVRQVNHPGTKGRYMFTRTAAEEGRAVAGIFSRHLAAL